MRQSPRLVLPIRRSPLTGEVMHQVWRSETSGSWRAGIRQLMARYDKPGGAYAAKQKMSETARIMHDVHRVLWALPEESREK